MRGAGFFSPVYLIKNPLGKKIIERRDIVLDASAGTEFITEFIWGRIFVLLNITFQAARYRGAKNFDIAFTANREIEGNAYLYRIVAAAFAPKRKEIIP
jgi:hypothetical protein